MSEYQPSHETLRIALHVRQLTDELVRVVNLNVERANLIADLNALIFASTADQLQIQKYFEKKYPGYYEKNKEEIATHMDRLIRTGF